MFVKKRRSLAAELSGAARGVAGAADALRWPANRKN